MRILLIEDNPTAVRLIQELLTRAGAPALELETTHLLATGLERLAAGDIDVVLLDLTLADCQGLDTYLRVHVHAPRVPIVILTAADDDVLPLEAIQEGAQDYLVKGQVDGKGLVRALRYAIERQRLLAALDQLAHDELTGLYNYRGFLTLAQQQVRLACRARSSFLLVFADVDWLKAINDTFGHGAGNRALIQTADVLRQTFRESDILGRVGGDEFAVLAIDADERSAGVILARLHQNLEAQNRRAGGPFTLSLSAGAAAFDPQRGLSLEQLMAEADDAMYAHKRDKKGSWTPAAQVSIGSVGPRADLFRHPNEENHERSYRLLSPASVSNPVT
jgi:diguanylate cyclase (GGDEF)-like protein